MKVGTDGVLLGAWIPEDLRPGNILDIGTGSGLIALMLAQKFPESRITAIDPEKESVGQASQNFSNSKWAENLTAEEGTLSAFGNRCNERFDLIVSNPPFHEEKVLSPDNRKKIAKSTSFLPFDELISTGSRLLSENGFLALILPFRYEDKILEMAAHHLLNVSALSRVRGHIHSGVKRSLFLFAKTFQPDTQMQEIYLEESRHHFSEAYKAMTKDYYIHL